MAPDAPPPRAAASPSTAAEGAVTPASPLAGADPDASPGAGPTAASPDAASALPSPAARASSTVASATRTAPSAARIAASRADSAVPASASATRRGLFRAPSEPSALRGAGYATASIALASFTTSGVQNARGTHPTLHASPDAVSTPAHSN